MRATRIELASRAWEASVLPLHYARFGFYLHFGAKAKNKYICKPGWRQEILISRSYDSPCEGQYVQHVLSVSQIVTL